VAGSAILLTLRRPGNRHGADRRAPVIGGGYRSQAFRSRLSFAVASSVVCPGDRLVG
jgi:hypothetical protein